MTEAEKLHSIINQSPSAMAIMKGPLFIFENVNLPWKNLVGQREYKGQSFVDIYPEFSGHQCHKILKSVYESGHSEKAIEISAQVEFSPGMTEERFFNFSYSRLENSSGKAYGVFAQAEDVTERVLTRNSLNQNLEQMAASIEVSKVGFYDWNMQDDTIHINDQMKQDWGINSGGTLLDALARIDPRDRERIGLLINQSAKTGEPYSAEYRVNHPSGNTIQIEARGRVSYDKSGSPFHFIGTTIDVTEKNKFAASLEVERHKLETLFEDSPAAMALWKGPQFIFEKVNSEFKNIFGDRNYVNTPLIEVLPELIDQTFPKLVEEVLRTGKTYLGREVLTRIGSSQSLPGEDRYFDLAFLQIKDSENHAYGVYCHAVEVTDRVQGRKELEISMVAAERANKTKSAFLANMSHEIRTPLGAILGFSELLKDSTSLNERASYSAIIHRNGMALTRLIDDILDLSKVEAGLIELEHITFNLRSLVQEVVDLFVATTKGKGLDLQVEINSNTPKMVKSDPVRIRQILVNLIGNGVKFTSKGYIKVTVGLIQMAPDQLGLEFLVQDSGVGLSKQQISRLFRPFTQADESTTRKFGGTGLGLFLSQKLANILGGDVRIIDAEIDKGCTIGATVCIDSADFLDKIEPPYKPLETTSLPETKILIIDDSKDISLLLEKMLKKVGIQVFHAENGSDGINLALKNNYDLILMDMQMPVLDGFKATKRLRESGYSKPIVALTAHSMAEDRQRTLAAGCNAHISKPLDSQLLVQTIVDFTHP